MEPVPLFPNLSLPVGGRSNSSTPLTPPESSRRLLELSTFTPTSPLSGKMPCGTLQPPAEIVETQEFSTSALGELFANTRLNNAENVPSAAYSPVELAAKVKNPDASPDRASLGYVNTCLSCFQTECAVETQRAVNDAFLTK